MANKPRIDILIAFLQRTTDLTDEEINRVRLTVEEVLPLHVGFNEIAGESAGINRIYVRFKREYIQQVKQFLGLRSRLKDFETVNINNIDNPTPVFIEQTILRPLSTRNLQNSTQSIENWEMVSKLITDGLGKKIRTSSYGRNLKEDQDLDKGMPGPFSRLMEANMPSIMGVM